MTDTPMITEADILSEVVAHGEPGFSQELARAILDLRFAESANARIRELLNKNNQGTIDEVERLVLGKYLRVGQFLDLMQAKAKLTLDQCGSSD